MSQHWTTSWNELSRTQWDDALRGQLEAYQQAWAYGDVMVRTGLKVHRGAISDPAGAICGLAQVIVRPVALVARFALCSYGPVWLKPMSVDERSAAMRSLRQSLSLRWPRLFAITPDDETVPRGFRRVMTGDATIRWDLTPNAEILRARLSPKWRAALSAAERTELTFTSSGSKPGQYRWIIEQELRQRQARGYRAMPPAHTFAWQEEKSAAKGADRKSGVLVYRADLGKETVAAMLFITHGAMATYHIGWNLPEGRKLGAHNLILWNAMLALKEKGYRAIDLGGVNTQSGAGIARFKLGVNGDVLQRPGAYV